MEEEEKARLQSAVLLGLRKKNNSPTTAHPPNSLVLADALSTLALD